MDKGEQGGYTGKSIKEVADMFFANESDINQTLESHTVLLWALLELFAEKNIATGKELSDKILNTSSVYNTLKKISKLGNN